VKHRWDAETLRIVRELASDLSSILTSLEVARQRHAVDRTVERSYVAATRMRESLERLIALLRM
jgi:hypothetical protein